MVASYKVPGDIQSGLTNDWEQWGWCFLPVWHPGLIPVYQKNSCTLLFSGLRSSWNLVKPLLRMNEAWMDECACRLQPLVDQYQPIQHETFTIEKFRDLIVITRSCPGEKNLLKNSWYKRRDLSYLTSFPTFFQSQIIKPLRRYTEKGASQLDGSIIKRFCDLSLKRFKIYQICQRFRDYHF